MSFACSPWKGGTQRSCPARWSPCGCLSTSARSGGAPQWWIIMSGADSGTWTRTVTGRVCTLHVVAGWMRTVTSWVRTLHVVAGWVRTVTGWARTRGCRLGACGCRLGTYSACACACTVHVVAGWVHAVAGPCRHLRAHVAVALVLGHDHDVVGAAAARPVLWPGLLDVLDGVAQRLVRGLREVLEVEPVRVVAEGEVQRDEEEVRLRQRWLGGARGARGC